MCTARTRSGKCRRKKCKSTRLSLPRSRSTHLDEVEPSRQTTLPATSTPQPPRACSHSRSCVFRVQIEDSHCRAPNVAPVIVRDNRTALEGLWSLHKAGGIPRHPCESLEILRTIETILEYSTTRWRSLKWDQPIRYSVSRFPGTVRAEIPGSRSPASTGPTLGGSSTRQIQCRHSRPMFDEFGSQRVKLCKTSRGRIRRVEEQWRQQMNRIFGYAD